MSITTWEQTRKLPSNTYGLDVMSSCFCSCELRQLIQKMDFKMWVNRMRGKKPLKTIFFDLSRVTWLGLMEMLSLTVAIWRIQRLGIPVEVILPVSEHVLVFLKRWKFGEIGIFRTTCARFSEESRRRYQEIEILEADNTDRLLACTSVYTTDEYDEYRQRFPELKKVLRNCAFDTDERCEQFCKLVTQEILKNIVEHVFFRASPGEQQMGLVAIQTFRVPKRKPRLLWSVTPLERSFIERNDFYLELAVVDSGMGIPGTLAEVCRGNNGHSDEQWIKLACETKMSSKRPGETKSEDEDIGMGLVKVREAVDKLGGYLHILSGRGHYERCSANHDRLSFSVGTSLERRSFPGTHFKILLPLDSEVVKRYGFRGVAWE